MNVSCGGVQQVALLHNAQQFWNRLHVIQGIGAVFRIMRS